MIRGAVRDYVGVGPMRQTSAKQCNLYAIDVDTNDMQEVT
jgi:hypothetical protein